MTNAAFHHMQSAVDIVADSPHPTNKIAATLVDMDGKAISATNYWPEPLAKAFAAGEKIGNSSGTLHAETACILKADKTEGASIFVTDPPCPNCMKNIAEAGITALYIDHKGFDKDFAQRRGAHFKDMSMRIAEQAGINVYKIWRKEERLEIIHEPPADYMPPDENPPLIGTPGDEDMLNDKVPYAKALATNQDGETVQIATRLHAAIGFTRENIFATEEKYNFVLEPLTRLLMTAKKHGLTLQANSVFSSRVPTARELVNYIGAGYTKIEIGNQHEARDEWALLALKQITDARVLEIR